MEKRGLMWFVGILLLLWLFIGSYLLSRHFFDEVKSVIVAEEVVGFSAKDGEFVLNADSYFRFPESSAAFEKISESLRNTLSETADYLKNNTNKELTIIGYYSEEERTPDLLPNYGLARANTIKKELEVLGVNTNQITTDSELANADNFKEGYFTNGIGYVFSEKSEGADTRLERIRADIVENAMTLYFKSGDQSLNLSADQKEDFSDMIYFLDHTENSTLEIGGHTDSNGDERQNKRLSRKRAESVRDYVARGGISINRISTIGYGQTKPIGNNKYKDGREKNRRVEIILKEG